MVLSEFKCFFRVGAILLIAAIAICASAQTNSITYQGRLTDGATPATGTYDLRFTLFATNAFGAPVAGPITNASVAVSNGIFTASMDFGSGVFTGDPRWLEIAVRTNGSVSPYVTLAPRQALTATPYSLYANSVNAAGVAGVIADSQLSANIARLNSNLVFTGAVQFLNTSNQFTGSFSGNGGAITGLDASHLSSGTIASARLPIATLDSAGGITTNMLASMTNVPYAQASAALTPPLGYNPWFAFGTYADEQRLKAVADFFVTNGFRDRGWKYVNMDDGWQATRNTNGAITWNTNRFPGGMPALANYMHARGLKFGLYTEPTTLSNDSSPDPSDYDNYHPGSYGHLEDDAAAFASWGVDYVKFDALPSVPQRTAVELFVSAIQRSARNPIFVGGSVGPFGTWMQSVMNSWRNSSPVGQGDFLMYAPENVLYTNVLGHLADIAYYPYAVGPGHWNDGDLLPMFPNNPDAFKAVFGMWAMMCSPIILSGLPAFDSEQFRACTNREALAISQDPAGIQAISVMSNATSQIWVRPLGTGYGGTKAVALLSRDVAGTNLVTVNWQDIGIAPGMATVRDVWHRHTLGYFTNNFSFPVGPKFAQLLTITPGIIPPYPVGTNSATDYQWDSVSGTTNFPPGGFQYLSSSLNPQFIYVNSCYDAQTGRSTPMKMNGITYPTGLSVFANADVKYFLGKRVNMFHAELGMDDQANNTVRIQILIDSGTNYDSGSIASRQPIREVNLPCGGATNLTIRVLTTGPNVFGSWVDVANPYFVVAPEAINPPSSDNNILVSSNGLPVWTTAAALGIPPSINSSYALTEFNRDIAQGPTPILDAALPNSAQISGFQWPPNANNAILSWKVPRDRITGTSVTADFSLLTTNAQHWLMAVQYFYVGADTAGETAGQTSGTLLVPVTSGVGTQLTPCSANFTIPNKNVWLAVRLRDGFGTTNSGSFWLREGKLSFN
jgi:alpha-galactosidase